MKEYFKTIWKTAALFLIFCVIMGVVFWLYGYPAEPVIYGALLCMIPAGVFLTCRYYIFRKRRKILECVRKAAPLELERLPEAENIHERYLTDIIWKLNRERMETEETRGRVYQEMTDYYTMWVHQIKNPIAALRLLLAEDHEKNKAALGEVFRVEEYVDMVLGYLRTEDMSADMKFSECSLDSIIREQIHKYASVFIGKKLALSYVGTEKRILTDPKWLGFVIGQCLSNALKYTKTGGIHIYLSESRSDTLVIEDTGTGIRQEDLPRVFERGFTGYNGREESRSTGIGLYLSRKIMKKLNHQIAIESSPGAGTKVYLSLGRKNAELF